MRRTQKGDERDYADRTESGIIGKVILLHPIMNG